MEANTQKRAGKGKGRDREMCWREREGQDLAAAEIHRRIFMQVVYSEDAKLMASSILVTLKAFVFSNWRILDFLNAGGYLCIT